ncbi:MAG: FAD:protein FMN transferase [Planctomycetaceae bacterium]|nr:FAD:protein FMN transferase [Planctomycetaceae bacterium]
MTEKHTRRDLMNAVRSLAASRPILPESQSRTDAVSGLVAPVCGDTIRIASRAMACEFGVILNPGSPEHLTAAGDLLNLVHDIELWLSAYQDNSELSVLNRQASEKPMHVRRSLFELLVMSKEIHSRTNGAFDITAGPLIKLWRAARAQKKIPTTDDVRLAMQSVGSQHLSLHEESCSVQFEVAGMALDPGAIGKGYALDEVAKWLNQTEEAPANYLLHGGHSSLIGRGHHNGLDGWPVGIGNPLFTEKRLATVLLRDEAMSTSGSNIQFYRYEGQRYGHILDPRTGWPVEGMLSVTVVAGSAALADAVSTAFFVLGVEKAVQCCENLNGVGVILMPFPVKGRKIEPVVVGIPADQIFWDPDQVVAPEYL